MKGLELPHDWGQPPRLSPYTEGRDGSARRRDFIGFSRKQIKRAQKAARKLRKRELKAQGKGKALQRHTGGPRKDPPQPDRRQ